MTRRRRPATARRCRSAGSRRAGSRCRAPRCERYAPGGPPIAAATSPRPGSRSGRGSTDARGPGRRRPGRQRRGNPRGGPPRRRCRRAAGRASCGPGASARASGAAWSSRAQPQVPERGIFLVQRGPGDQVVGPGEASRPRAAAAPGCRLVGLGIGVLLDLLHSALDLWLDGLAVAAGHLDQQVELLGVLDLHPWRAALTSSARGRRGAPTSRADSISDRRRADRGRLAARSLRARLRLHEDGSRPVVRAHGGQHPDDAPLRRRHGPGLEGRVPVLGRLAGELAHEDDEQVVRRLNTAVPRGRWCIEVVAECLEEVGQEAGVGELGGDRPAWDLLRM